MEKNKKRPVSVTKDNRVFTLDVFLFSGDVSKIFLKENKVVSRTIEIRGNQTLEDLHGCIFKAFNRFEEHFYEFQFGGKGPDDPAAKRYVLPAAENKDTYGDLTKTTIGSIGLKVGDIFGYIFDYGDNWQHQIDVVTITESTSAKRYPRIIKQVGQSPPQYRDDE